MLPATKFCTAEFTVLRPWATVMTSCLGSSLESPCDAKVWMFGLWSFLDSVEKKCVCLYCCCCNQKDSSEILYGFVPLHQSCLHHLCPSTAFGGRHQKAGLWMVHEVSKGRRSLCQCQVSWAIFAACLVHSLHALVVTGHQAQIAWSAACPLCLTHAFLTWSGLSTGQPGLYP